MNQPHLEERLRQLAEGLEAPATEDARRTIGDRAGALRHRRRVGRAVGGGILTMALLGVLVGGLALQDEDQGPDTESGGFTGEGEEGVLAGLTLDGVANGLRWEVREATESSDVQPQEAIYPLLDGSLQVFRAEGTSGPSVIVVHQGASDAYAPTEDDATVPVGDVDGYLARRGTDGLRLRWDPLSGDSAVSLVAFGMTQDEVIEVANGLDARDEDINYPVSPDDEFGFDASDLPRGLQEAGSYTGDELLPQDARRMVLEAYGDSDAGGDTTISLARATIQIEYGGWQDTAAPWALAATSQGEVEQVQVMDQPAILIHGPDGGGYYWNLVWRAASDTLVSVNVTSSTTGASEPLQFVDGFIDGIQELSEEEWETVLAEHG